jgi:hypothetical protein
VLVEHLPVEVHADVGLHVLGTVVQHLEARNFVERGSILLT